MPHHRLLLLTNQLTSLFSNQVLSLQLTSLRLPKLLLNCQATSSFMQLPTSPIMLDTWCSFIPRPRRRPFMDEFDNHRINQLESSFIQSQRNSLLESRMVEIKSCNFALTLPDINLAEYQKLPIETSTRAACRLPPSKMNHCVKSSMKPEEEELCHCGLQPAIFTIQAPGPNFERKFMCCIQKEDDQCSYLRWKKIVHEKPEVIDIYYSCGKVSEVKTVKKNVPNWGRLYYCCSRMEMTGPSFGLYNTASTKSKDQQNNNLIFDTADTQNNTIVIKGPAKQHNPHQALWKADPDLPRG